MEKNTSTNNFQKVFLIHKLTLNAGINVKPVLLRDLPEEKHNVITDTLGDFKNRQIIMN